jgi:CHAT domain-containing protein
LAAFYGAVGRYSEAELLFRQTLAISEKNYPLNHPEIALQLHNFASFYLGRKAYEKAAELERRALAIREMKLGEGHRHLATSLHTLGNALSGLGRASEAEVLLRRSLSVHEKVLGPNHPEVATMAGNLGVLMEEQSRYADAEALYQRALTIRETTFGKEHHSVGQPLSLLVGMYDHQGAIDKALARSNRLMAILRNQAVIGRMSTTSNYDSQTFLTTGFSRHASLLLRVSQTGTSREALREDEIFETIQWARFDKAGVALTNAALRLNASTPVLASKVRARQDAVTRRHQFDRQLIELLGKSFEQRQPAAEKELRERIAVTEIEIQRLDDELLRDFPAYRELTSPKPIPLAEAQKLLGPDEALVAWLVLGKETLLFLVRTDRAEVVKFDAGREQLEKLVRSLRNATEFSYSGDVVPFPYDTAHELYKLLIGPIEKQLAGVKHLILVPDGPLQSLSFGLLKVGAGETVADKPQEIPWLSRQYALTTLPAITSLRALRKLGKAPGQREPFVGFGDPTLSGDKAEKRNLNVARLFSKGQVADVRAVADMQSLPETADELRSIAHTLKAGPGSIHLREAATETQVKKLPLYRYRVVAFATHGLVAGEFRGVQEPSLVLTPPSVGSDLDDGLLTASEVAGLKLDADWVILSACNTAAPDGTLGAGGFTGLTKAFFYAGARAVLVSHWSVDSQSAMALTTRMFAETEKGATKAEALRRAMMALADEPETAHPAFWAPFVVVGEGAR